LSVQPTVKRLSLLKRSASLTREQFFVHYESVHGPLASSQRGFRKFTYCYVQNHFTREFRHDGEPAFDGMTATYQVPRADMQRGFFQEPDYLQFVRPDEERLFDLTRTRSILAIESVVLDGEPTAWKAIALCSAGGAESFRKLRGVRRFVVNDLIASTAGVLGGTPGKFDFSNVAEMWFEDDARMERTLGSEEFPSDDGHSESVHLFSAREITIFRDPRPKTELEGAA
jgi:hypothetical protein